MTNFIRLIFITVTFLCSAAHAETKVLGFEIGISTLEQVKSTLIKQTKVSDNGTNKFTAGPMLKTDGSSYEIDGLNEVLYIFDDQKKLAGVLMGMDKEKFDGVFKAISGKYKATFQQRPFVGNQFARFKTPDAVIEMDAPHLSFNMSVNYLRNDLMQKYNSQTAAESEVKKKREAAKF